jgi:polysaccharide biosynthesis/export protein
MPKKHQNSSTPWSMVHGPWSKLMVYCLLSTVLFFSFSCTTQKQITYLQGIDTGQNNFFPYSRPDYRLQKQDVLYVKISTLNEEVNNMLYPGGGSTSQQATQMQGAGAYLLGYLMNDSGKIALPLIGNVLVFEKTLDEATKLIEEKVSLMLKDATVVVKLLSYNITILGEVKSPGTFTHFGKQLTILDAIGMAGDLTDYGDRSSILIVRPTQEGSTTLRINLKDKNLLVSEAYFLLPNDIVIVGPRKVKLLNLNTDLFSFIFSTISMTLLILKYNN